MKKVVSIILIIVMMLSVLILPAYASEISIYNKIPATENKYCDKAKEYIGENYTIWPQMYRELCYYSDENQEEADWVLMVCRVMPMGKDKFGVLIGDRALWTIMGSGLLNKFQTGLAVYIPKSDEFIELINANVDEIIEKCPNFVKVIEEKEIGQMMGDVNEDDVIDIIDATYIQRVIAGIPSDYRVYVYSWGDNFYISDFDRDGEVTVMDATAIQRHIAGIE